MFRTARPNLPIFSARAEAPIEPTAAAAGLALGAGGGAGAGCRTRESSLVAGLFQTPLSRRRREDQLALASAASGTAVAPWERRSNRAALTTSRRSRIPMSLAIVSSALRSPDVR